MNISVVYNSKRKATYLAVMIMLGKQFNEVNKIIPRLNNKYST